MWRTDAAVGDAVRWSRGSAAPATCIRIDGRIRRSRGSREWQTSQSQPMAGTPWDVPVPRRVTLRLNNPLPAALRLHEAQPQLVEHLLQHLALLRREVAACLHVQQREDFNHLRGAVE